MILLGKKVNTIFLDGPLGVVTSEVQLFRAVLFLAEAAYPSETLFFRSVLMLGVLYEDSCTSSMSKALQETHSVKPSLLLPVKTILEKSILIELRASPVFLSA